MSLTIELSPIQEQIIREAAEREGVSISEVVSRTLEEKFPAANGSMNGALNPKTGDEVAHWEREDAPASDEERAEDERIFEQLHSNMNETRRYLGMREI